MATKHIVRNESTDYASLPLVGENNVLYELQDNGELYRWDSVNNIYVNLCRFNPPISTNVIAYVESSIGDDGTGEIGNKFKPYESINAAAIAVDNYINSNHGGDPNYPRLVYVFAGNFGSISINLISNMVYYAETGVVIKLQGQSVFNINSSLINCRFLGNASFLDYVGYDSTLIQGNNNSVAKNFYLEFDEVISTFYVGIFAGARNDSQFNDLVVIKGNKYHSLGDGSAYGINCRNYFNTDIEIGEIIIGGGLVVLGGGPTNYFGNFKLRCNTITTTGSVNLNFDAGATFWMVGNYLNADIEIEIKDKIHNQRSDTFKSPVFLFHYNTPKSFKFKGDVLSDNNEIVRFNSVVNADVREVEFEGSFKCLNSNTVVFNTNSNSVSNVITRFKNSTIESVGSYSDIFTADNAKYQLALYNTKLKSDASPNIDLGDINFELFMYDSKLFTNDVICVMSQPGSMDMKTIGCVSNVVPVVDITDLWSSIQVIPIFEIK